MRNLSVTLALIGILAGTESRSAAVSTTGAEVEAISRARFKALIDRDTTYLKDHYTGDFQAVGSDGRLVGISFLEWVIRNAPKDANFEPFDYRVMVSADGTQAVAFHKTHDTWDGQHSDVAYTEVYVRRKGRWLLRFEQYGEIRPPDAS